MALFRAFDPSRTRFGGAVLATVLFAACGGDSTQPPAEFPEPVAQPDPLQSEQWFLHNTGQAAFASRGGRPGIDLNVMPVHEDGVYGQGVKVMVIDSGLEHTHEDLAANIDRTMLHSFDPASTDPADAMPPGDPPDPADTHGTAVAGIIGAIRHNQKGGIGVAPDATLGGIRYICGAVCDSALNQVEMFGRAPFSSESWLFNGSYGSTPYAPTSVDYDDGAYMVALLGLARLRDGKGALFVKGAGNSFHDVGDPDDPAADVRCVAAQAAGLSCHNPNSDPDAIPPTAIVVGGVNADGIKASYSSAGSNLFVVGTAGEYGFSHPKDDKPHESGPAIIAPDFSGCHTGYSRRGLEAYGNDFDNPDTAVGTEHNADCNYTATMNGTSSAAPSVSGVIALMLSANPDLTWRDVRDILVRTSRSDILQAPPVVKIPLEDGEYVADPGWQVNAVGRVFSSWYGYGLVDAAAAVREARKRPGGQLNGDITDTGWVWTAQTTALDVPLSRLSGAADTLEIAADLTIEGVVAEVYLNGQAPLGDIAIELVSPAGTRSVLMAPHSLYDDSPAESAKDGMLSAANVFYGEKAAGNWTLRIVDINTRGDTADSARLARWRMRVYGH